MITLLLLSGLVLVSFGPPSPVSAADFSSWTSYKTITFDSTQVPSTQTNIPLLIKITDTDLRDDAQNDGDDIAFSLTDGTTQLNHEIEYFDGATGELVAWVNVTSLSSSSDTTIYMYYNNSVASNQEDVSGTWDSSYLGVYHMNASSGNQFDSVGTKDAVASGSPSGYQSTGIAKYCMDFDGIDDYFNFTDNVYDWVDSDFTIMLFANYDDNDTNHHAALTITDNGGSGDSDWDNTIQIKKFKNSVNGGRAGAYLHNDSGPADSVIIPDPTFIDEWHMYEWSCDYPNLYLRRDGVAIDSTTTQSYDTNEDMLMCVIGASKDDGTTAMQEHMDGMIDEIRISSIKRSVDYSITTYNSINNASDGDFFDVGSETANDETSSYSVTNLDTNTRILWSGQAGDNLYSNDTVGGGNNATLTVNVNASEDCTDIFFDLSGDTTLGSKNEVDFDSSSGNASMYLQVGTDDSWSDEWVQFTDANSYNISLNTSWSSLSDDPNPFPIENADDDVVITCIFKLELEGTITAVGTFTTANTVWEIVFKSEEV